MHIVSIKTNAEFNGCRDRSVKVIPVANFDVAQNVIISELKDQFRENDITVEPVIDGEHYHDCENNNPCNPDDADSSYILHKTENTNPETPVAELTFGCSFDYTEYSWFLVD